uniref:NADH-ubiquinone oxidoreductase chain 4 n=1 Tax=Centrorhynchus clitorideus TaxID=2731796 RepID=A0A6M3YWT5_9BILA|nr:NADH dehydrogenase subunit 4 [Centrorhynchus clitorideus]
MMGGLLFELFWVVVLGWAICWYVMMVLSGSGVGVFYEGSGFVSDWVVIGVVLLVGVVWVGMGGVYGAGVNVMYKFSTSYGGSVISEGGLSLLLGVMMVLVFVVDSWLSFYVVYEGSMLPLLVGVCLFGSYYERIVSVVYLLVYLVLFSVPLVLVLLVGLGNGENLLMIEESFCWVTGWVWCLLLGSMLVKVPLWGVHSWLPKVHVEAPTWGSVVLAGVMIKMGVYGLWRVRGVGGSWVGMWDWLWLWALVGGVGACVLCFYVSDYKMLVAYSSVFHMAGVVWMGGVWVMFGWRGVLLVMMMHGVVSGALFMLAGGMSELGESRSLALLGGLVDFLSVGGLLVVVGMVLNVGFPVSGNMVAELEVVLGVMGLWSWGWVVFGVMMFMAGLFNMFVLVSLFSVGDVRKDVELGSGLVIGMGIMEMVSVAGLLVVGVVF